MQPKLGIYSFVVIFLVFEAAVYFYFDNTSNIKKQLTRDILSVRLGFGSDPESADLGSPLGDVLCSPMMFEKTRPNGSSCLCLTDDQTLLLRQFNLQEMVEYIRNHRKERFQCAMTVSPNGRLGNLMGEYATLYALAKLNSRPAFLPMDMARTLRSYFDVSIPTMRSSDNEELEYMWTNIEVRRWMEPSYAHLNEMFVRITGPPYSWTFYEDVKDEIAREFTFRDSILRGVQSVFRKIAESYHRPESSITFIGVHARRTDAIGWIENYHGRVADKTFFHKAMNIFRQKYREPVFIVASDDMEWCRNNIKATNDVYFIGEGNVNHPIHDFALLASCNHSIISIGTYGYWTAYLAGGETIYLANYTSQDSHYLKKFTYETMYLPHWKGIS